MVNQIAEMFPQISRDQILNVVRQTGSVTLAVEALIENAGAANDNQLRVNNQVDALLEDVSFGS